MNRLRFNATITRLSSRSTPLNSDESGFAPPDAFGPFRVRHAMGAGVLGPVFRAYEADAERDVAVKLFRLDLAPERVHELVNHLNRLIAAGIAHPSLVTPIAAGISVTRAYLVEELVEGDSLDVVLRDRAGVTSSADALRLVTQVAAALDAAAAKGLLHGALHPRDVLSADGTLVRVTGIGVAQALEGVGAGVPVRRPYASPERVTGVRWDRPADVFSLAALAHEVLWGRRVAGVGERVGNALTDLAGADLAALRRVFVQALAPSPADRFETAGEFAVTLGECFDPVGHMALRAVSPRRQTRTDRPAAPRTPPPSTPVARLPLEADPDIPEAAVTPAPVASRIIRDPVFDPPLAPVRFEAGPPPADDRPTVGRRHRGADRAATLLTPPERPLPLLNPDDDDDGRSAIWTLALTAVVFLALGFAGGYWVASSGQPAPAPVATAPLAPEPAAVATAPPVVAPAFESAAPAVPPVEMPIVANASGAPLPPVPDEAPLPRVAQDPAQSAPPRPAPSRPVSSRPVQPRSVAAASPASRPASRVIAPAGPGILQVDSRPAGANVYVDGRLRGRTPLQLDGIAAGEHGIRLQLDGYTEWLTAVGVPAGGKQRVAASLEPRN